MNRGDDEVEGRQRLLIVVKLTVAQDVALGALEDTQPPIILAVELHRFRPAGGAPRRH